MITNKLNLQLTANPSLDIKAYLDGILLIKSHQKRN